MLSSERINGENPPVYYHRRRQTTVTGRLKSDQLRLFELAVWRGHVFSAGGILQRGWRLSKAALDNPVQP